MSISATPQPSLMSAYGYTEGKKKKCNLLPAGVYACSVLPVNSHGEKFLLSHGVTECMRGGE